MKTCRNCCAKLRSRSRARSISCRWAGRKRWGHRGRRWSRSLVTAPLNVIPFATLLELRAIRRCAMRPLTAVFASLLFFVPLASSQEDHHHAISEEEVGSVHFLTSCGPDLAESFNRAVALLHSFQYEQARQAFTEISERYPECAIAQCDLAMSHSHLIGDNGDTAT